MCKSHISTKHNKVWCGHGRAGIKDKPTVYTPNSLKHLMRPESSAQYILGNEIDRQTDRQADGKQLHV